VWDPYNKDKIQKLEVFQNKAVRFIYNIKGREESMTDVKRMNNIKTLEWRRQKSRFSTIHSILRNEALHPSLCSLLTTMKSNKLSMSTRTNAFNPSYIKTNMYLNSFIPRTTRELRTGDTLVE